MEHQNVYLFRLCFIICLIFMSIFIKTINISNIDDKQIYNKTSVAWIDNNKYPMTKELFEHKNIFKNDLLQVLETKKWHVWSDDYKTTPIFTKMSDKEIKEHLYKNVGSVKKDGSAWRLFPIILNKKCIRDDNLCNNTINILDKYKGKILNAGFSLLEPGCHIGLHKDYNKTFYRLHIPLIIPKNNNLFNTFISKEEAINNEIAVLQVENDYRVWKEDDYFILNDTYDHDAWNNSEEIRIVMLIDYLI